MTFKSFRFLHFVFNFSPFFIFINSFEKFMENLRYPGIKIEHTYFQRNLYIYFT